MVASTLVYVPVTTNKKFNYWWASTITNFISASGAFVTLDSMYAFTDITLNAIIVPEVVAKYFKDDLLSNVTPLGTDPVYGTTFACSTSLPTVALRFGETYWFDLTRAEYLVNIGGNCALAFIVGTDYWVLGIPFLKDLYHVHDYDNKQQGFALTVA
jgi:hypothetical protein